MTMRPQPLLVVADVQRASRWYQHVMAASSGHGGDEYEQVLVEGSMVLQLHTRDAAHHHGAIADPEISPGNGVAVWFETDDFDGVVDRSHAAAPTSSPTYTSTRTPDTASSGYETLTATSSSSPKPVDYRESVSRSIDRRSSSPGATSTLPSSSAVPKSRSGLHGRR
jgi:hypothetical protein